MAAILLASSSFAQSSSQTDTQTSQTDTPNPANPPTTNPRSAITCTPLSFMRSEAQKT